jgi:superfamily II helicase
VWDTQKQQHWNQNNTLNLARESTMDDGAVYKLVYTQSDSESDDDYEHSSSDNEPMEETEEDVVLSLLKSDREDSSDDEDEDDLPVHSVFAASQGVAHHFATCKKRTCEHLPVNVSKSLTDNTLVTINLMKTLGHPSSIVCQG